MDNDVGSGFFGKDRGGGEIPGNNDALASRKLLDLDYLGGEVLELGKELQDSEGRESFLLRRSAG